LHALNWSGIARRVQGELRAALQDFRARLALAVELGLVAQIISGQEQIALTCFDLGEWAEAREALSAALALAPTEKWDMALSAWFHGDQTSAIALAERELDTARERHDLPRELEMLATLGYIRSQMGQVEEALVLLRRALTLDPPEWRVPYILCELALVVAFQGDPEAATLVAESLARLEDGRLGESIRAHLLHARGQVLARAGDTVGALAALRESAAVARGQENRLILAHTLLTLAQVVRATDDEATAAEADLERVAIVKRIGPETRGLIWAEGVFSSSVPSEETSPRE
jgi:tetratricopeptide (TPR) repeat protein